MTQQHFSPEPQQFPASQPGGLAHWATTCSCGLKMADSMLKSNVQRDVREHEAYFAAKARKGR